MKKQNAIIGCLIPVILSLGCSRNPSSNRGDSGAPPNDVPRIDRVANQQFYVVGLSSGGFMATQMSVAYSSLFSGVGVFDGGVYGCSQGSWLAAGACLQNAKSLQPGYFVQRAQNSASMGLIDATDTIAGQRVFVYAGGKDTVVDPAQAKKITSFYESFGAKSVVSKEIQNAGHGIPTLNYGGSCGASASPWFTNCGFDGAGGALAAMIPGIGARGVARPENFSSFEQGAYGSSTANLSKTGYVYVPQSCKSDSRKCSVLLALHGCEQSTDSIGPEFALHSGFNEWAETNRLIVIYPSVAKSLLNPGACWDWWGYTGLNFANRQAPQIQAMYRMMEKFSKTPQTPR